MKGIIVENISNLYRVKVIEESNVRDKVYEANARGKFKKDDITPVVGDFVECEVVKEDKEKDRVSIDKILDRNVYIKRPKLANISKIVLVVSSKHPKPDLLMLDKQLAFAEFLGIEALIVLNKIDLDKEKSFKEIKRVYEKVGYKVLETEAKVGKGIVGKGIDKLRKELLGNTNAFSGNSGVGKSTLINAIFGEDITQEGEISKKSRRGKNTTTSTKLYEIDEGTYIADTPGFSTFDISEIESKDLASYFKEFKQYIPDCEFVGCTHIKEENCGIKNAIKEGKIEQERYDRFCKIYQELKQKEERKKW